MDRMAFKSMDRIVEARIQEAISRGDFDKLPGRGKPLKEDDLAGLTRDERIEAILARCVGGVPEEVSLLREISELRAAIAAPQSEAHARRLAAELRDKSLRLSILFESSGKMLMAREALKLADG
jgi:hypothetical protein